MKEGVLREVKGYLCMFVVRVSWRFFIVLWFR